MLGMFKPAEIIAGVLGVIGALAIAFAMGGFYGSHLANQKAEARIVVAKQEAWVEERNWEHYVDVVRKEKDLELENIRGRLNDALGQLRKRPERLSSATAPTCEGATGSQLSRPDAEFLEREAARAQGLVESLKECYAYVDKVQEVYGGR